jgi:transcriptional regulator with XRE-family HTH domain
MQNNRTTISQFLKQERQARGWSQRELARRLVCPQATVQMWEAEKTRPDLSSMEKIAQLFGLTLSKLFEALETGGSRTAQCSMNEIIDAVRTLPINDVARINVAVANRITQAC